MEQHDVSLSSASSPSSSSASSSSAASSSELEFAAEYSSAAASSSKSSLSSIEVVWVKPKSLGSRFSSEIWYTDLFVVSRQAEKASGKRNIKCLECTNCNACNEWASGKMNYDGTSTPSYHAERVHGNLPKVRSWLNR